MVSIRMPKSLINELKDLAKSQHFMDLSEEVRTVVRKKWNYYSHPQLFEIKRLREGIVEEIKQKSARKIEDEVAKELEKIKTQLKKEGLSNAR